MKVDTNSAPYIESCIYYKRNPHFMVISISLLMAIDQDLKQNTACQLCECYPNVYFIYKNKYQWIFWFGSIPKMKKQTWNFGVWGGNAIMEKARLGG